MEIVKSIYDLASVLVFFGIAMAPRAMDAIWLFKRKTKQVLRPMALNLPEIHSLGRPPHKT